MYFYSFVVVFVLLCTITISVAADPEWDYGEYGPDVWGDLFPTCNGQAQSPINILTACTSYQAFAPFQFSSAYALLQNFTITNNGHNLIGRQVDANSFPLTLNGGGLTEPFIFDSFHLHWGENYKSSSEHQINGQKYAGEVHFVHTNLVKTRYAVLGMFMQSTAPDNLGENQSSTHRRKRRRSKRQVLNTDNATISEWVKYFPVVKTLTQTNSTAVLSLKLGAVIGTNLTNFYRYSGSLTTPPCSEVVTWTVFQTPIQFTDDEIEELRTEIFAKDFRQPQPLNGRSVFRSYK